MKAFSRILVLGGIAIALVGALLCVRALKMTKPVDSDSDADSSIYVAWQGAFCIFIGGTLAIAGGKYLWDSGRENSRAYPTDQINKSMKANRRCNFALVGEPEFGRAICAPPLLRAAVAYFLRWMI